MDGARDIKIVRCAGQADFERVSAIWIDRFDDTAEYVRSVFGANEVLVVESNGLIESFCVLVEARVVLAGSVHRLLYIYACATDTRFEGQGNLGMLIEKAFAVACQRGFAASIIVPDNRLTTFAVSHRSFRSGGVEPSAEQQRALRSGLCGSAAGTLADMVRKVVGVERLVDWHEQRWELLRQMYCESDRLPLVLPYYIKPSPQWPDREDCTALKLIMPY